MPSFGEVAGVRLQPTNRCRLSSFAEKAASTSGEISDGVLWDREVNNVYSKIAIA